MRSHFYISIQYNNNCTIYQKQPQDLFNQSWLVQNNVSMHMYTHAHIRIQHMHKHNYIYIHTLGYIHTPTHSLSLTHAHVHTHVCAHTYTHIDIHIHTHMYTHIIFTDQINCLKNLSLPLFKEHKRCLKTLNSELVYTEIT